MDMSSFLNTYMLLNFRDGFNLTSLYIPLFIFILQYIVTNPSLILDKIKSFVIKQKQCIKTYKLTKTCNTIGYKDENEKPYLIESLYFHLVKNNKLLNIHRDLTLSSLHYIVTIDKHTRRVATLPIHQEIHLDEDIYLYMREEKIIKTIKDSKTNNDTQIEDFVYYIELYCKYHYLDYLYSKVDHYVETYNNHINKLRIKYVREQTIYSDAMGVNELSHIITTKTFNNLFFEAKVDIINKINDFIDQQSEYNRLGIPHTLGFLFYGEPGTGKTSCIKAIAKHLNRHIIIVDMKKINTNYYFRHLFHDTTNVDNSIYIFEEIDCISNDDYNPFLDREQQKSNNTEEKKNDITDLVQILNKGDDIKKIKRNEDSLTLSTILETLDGIVEHSNRICIFTTNYKDKIDKALLRPGRIDMCVEFKRLRKCDLQDMYQLWFHQSIPINIYTKMNDYKFTQAEIGNLFSKYRHNLNDLHQKLIS